MSIASHTDVGSILTNANPPKVDISGMRYARLLVLGFYGRRGVGGRAFYRCQCDCGNLCIIEYSKLKNGHTSSCGCLHADTNRLVHSIDISGSRFGRLVATSFSHRKNKQTFWNVKCDCGTVCVVNYAHIVDGRTKSCGCIKRELMASKSGEASHLWRGGASTKPWAYPKEWNERTRELVRNRDSRTCQFPECTYSDIGKDKRLDVHHIDGNKQDCRAINLISLCHSHHMKVEMSPRTWEDYFYSVVSDYEFR